MAAKALIASSAAASGELHRVRQLPAVAAREGDNHERRARPGLPFFGTADADLLDVIDRGGPCALCTGATADHVLNPEWVHVSASRLKSERYFRVRCGRDLCRRRKPPSGAHLRHRVAIEHAVNVNVELVERQRHTQQNFLIPETA